MSHHWGSGRPLDAVRSISKSLVRVPVVWNSQGLPEDAGFPLHLLQPGDFALRENGEFWVYTGERWHLLVPSVPQGSQRPVVNLTAEPGPEVLNVEYEDG